MEIAQVQSFQTEMLGMIKSHGAINNEFLTRFAKENVSKREFERFAVEFFHFSRHFPLVLCSLLINTEDEAEAAELTKIMASELGDGVPEKRHELLYRRFLRSIGIEPRDVLHMPMLNSTRGWIMAQMKLYSGKDHFAGLGASFGLENMAIPMWDQLLDGLAIAKAKWFPTMDITYFTFHRALEEEHEHAMENALGVHENNPAIQVSFQGGISKVLNAEEAFWLGLSDVEATA